MNKYTLLLGIVLCLVAVNGRNYGERSDIEEQTGEHDESIDAISKARERGLNQIRHRRKRRQMNYGYNYPAPYNPYYPNDRSYYDRGQQELYPQILKLLDEISVYVKRPPTPPPQPIYVPYPVPYPVPRQCNCPGNGTVTTDSRFGFDLTRIDSNRNWGFYDQEEDTGAGIDYVRELSFDPIPPQRPTSRPTPQVEHGTSQASVTTQRPRFVPKASDKPARVPKVCDAAALSCCRPSESKEVQRRCFFGLGCGSSYANGNACRPEAIASILNIFSKTYSPMDEI